MSTVTVEQRQAIADYLAAHHLTSGLGTEDEPCSVSAINLALTGRLTDNIPECMSRVVGEWVVRVQDAMPDEMRNSAGWKQLLPLAAGTGRGLERERLQVVVEWMWTTVLPYLQPLADDRGFGVEWRTMCEQRTDADADAYAAFAAKADADADAYSYAYAASCVAYAVKAAAADAAVWRHFDPVGLLARLVQEPVVS